MSKKHSYLTVFKRRAKALAHDQGLQLSVAQEKLATDSGFANFHELTTVASRHPDDSRLMVAAFGMRDLADLIYEEDAYFELSMEVEEALSAAIAETNAYAFGIDDVHVLSAALDESSGHVKLDLTFEYAGEQDPEKMYHGAAFDIAARVYLHFVDGTWRLLSDDGLELLKCESDRDRDCRDELEAPVG